MVGRVWPRHSGGGRPLNSVVRHHMTALRTASRNWKIWMVGAIAAAVHLAICFTVTQQPSEGSWGWFPVFVLDFPFSIVITMLSPRGSDPLMWFGVLGSAWWFFLAAGATIVLRRWVSATAGAAASK